MNSINLSAALIAANLKLDILKLYVLDILGVLEDVPCLCGVSSLWAGWLEGVLDMLTILGVLCALAILDVLYILSDLSSVLCLCGVSDLWAGWLEDGEQEQRGRLGLSQWGRAGGTGHTGRVKIVDRVAKWSRRPLWPGG